LERADHAYDEKIQEAEEKSHDIMQEWLKKKDQIIAEAGMLANKRKDEILIEAKNKAQDLVREAETKSEHLEAELKNNFANGVKKTSLLVVKKLFKDSDNLQKEYLDEVVAEIVK